MDLSIFWKGWRVYEQGFLFWGIFGGQSKGLQQGSSGCGFCRVGRQHAEVSVGGGLMEKWFPKV